MTINRDPLTGVGQRINNAGYALGNVICKPYEMHTNILHKQSYVALIAADPSAVTADFFYLKNLDDDDLIIYKMKGWLDNSAAGVVEVSVTVGVTGTTTAGVALVPTNMTVGSGLTANATCEYKDGDMALTGGTVMDKVRIDPAAIGEQYFDFPAGIRLRKNETLVFNNDIDPVGHAIDMSVYFFFHNDS